MLHKKIFFVKESRSYDVQIFSKIMLSSHYAIGIKEQKHHCSLFITARSQKVPKLLVAVARAEDWDSSVFQHCEVKECWKEFIRLSCRATASEGRSLVGLGRLEFYSVYKEILSHSLDIVYFLSTYKRGLMICLIHQEFYKTKAELQHEAVLLRASAVKQQGPKLRLAQIFLCQRYTNTL